MYFPRCASNSPYCLGKTEYECCDLNDFVPDREENMPTGRKHILPEKTGPNPKKICVDRENIPTTASSGKLSPSKRFNKIVTDKEVEEASKGYVPVNTARSTGWALRVFLEWAAQDNKHNRDRASPLDLLDKEYSCDTLCNHLKRFVAEARRGDGTPYRPKTLYQILCGLLCHSREVQPNVPNFLDRKDLRFKSLHCTCDSIFQNLHQSGIGAEKKSALPISRENEDKLWESGVLNTNSPDGLQKAVFFYVEKVCCLRGGEEQRYLTPSQFVRLHNPERYLYSENGSKNRNGGFYQL